ncbi:MAG: GrpB family protein [Burkholderiaceae bacterium]
MIPAGLMRDNDEIVVVPHSAAWSGRFRVESQLLHVALSALKPVIEHIGSTAVAGLAAKPIIDMLVGVESLTAFESQAQRLAVFGYQYIPEYERALPDRRFFKRVVMGVRTHHVHVVEKNGLYWKRYLKFRNSLRDDPWMAARYAELKRRLAARYCFDRDAYTNGKTGFIEAVLAMPPRPTVRDIAERAARTIIPLRQPAPVTL